MYDCPVEGKSRLVHGAPLQGVVLQHLVVHHDDRGSFAEVLSTERDTGLAPQQWSVVRSVARSLRGMHYHLRHDECVSVVDGRLSVGLHDLRVGSETFGRSGLYDLTGADPAYLYFPRGLVHGWVAHEATTHLQAVSETYASYGADDNNGCRWDDPELDLPWPVTPTVFSERSRSFGPLAELRRLTEQTLPAH